MGCELITYLIEAFRSTTWANAQRFVNVIQRTYQQGEEFTYFSD